MSTRNISRHSPEKSGPNPDAPPAKAKTVKVDLEGQIRQKYPIFRQQAENMARYKLPRDKAHEAVDEAYDEVESEEA